MNYKNICFELFIPVLPVAKGRPRMGMHGFYTPEKTRNYEAEIRMHALAEKKLQSLAEPTPETVSLEADIVFYFPIPQNKLKKIKDNAPMMIKPDLDNLVKSILDGLQGILFKDDKQITKITASKLYHHKLVGSYVILTSSPP